MSETDKYTYPPRRPRDWPIPTQSRFLQLIGAKKIYQSRGVRVWTKPTSKVHGMVTESRLGSAGGVPATFLASLPGKFCFVAKSVVGCSWPHHNHFTPAPSSAPGPKDGSVLLSCGPSITRDSAWPEAQREAKSCLVRLKRGTIAASKTVFSSESSSLVSTESPGSGVNDTCADNSKVVPRSLHLLRDGRGLEDSQNVRRNLIKYRSWRAA